MTGEIGAGLMILLGVGREDTAAVAAAMAEKVANLRIFEDEQRQDESLAAGCEGQRAGGFAIYVVRRCARAAAAKFYFGGAAGERRKRCTKSFARRCANWVCTSRREFFRR